MTAQEIKALRKSLGLHQKEFANRLKVDTITVSRWERGIQKPSPVLIRKLERLMNNKKGDK